MTEDDSDRGLEFCEWIQKKVGQNAKSLGVIVWSHQPTFKLWTWKIEYSSSKNLNVHVNKAVNLPRLSVWFDVSSWDVVRPFFEGTVTLAAYLNILQESIVSAARHLYGDEDTWYQQDWARRNYGVITPKDTILN